MTDTFVLEVGHFVSVERAHLKPAQVAEGDGHRSMPHDSLHSAQIPRLFVDADGTSVPKTVEGLVR